MRRNSLIFAFVYSLVFASCNSAIAQVKVDPKSPIKKYVDKYLATSVKKGVPEPKTNRVIAQKFIDHGWLIFKKKLDYDAAYTDFFQAINADRTYAPAYFGVAFLSSNKNQLADAVIFYREALKYEKKFGPIYTNLATALNLQNPNNPEIASLLEESIKNCPKFTDAYLIYADFLAAKNNWKKAAEIVNTAVKLGVKIPPDFVAEFKQHGITISEK
ncbi:MAG: hypothetical protein SFY67_15070 [Candidatus Melainabacteria bacterium]|nr:hypothetical protein [Candidatus Melainabacteria bacterium]